MKKIVERQLLLWDASRHGVEPYRCTLVFRRADPFAVDLVFPVRDITKVTNDQLRVHPDSRDDAISVVITFSRTLVIDGMEAPAGAGTVRIEPHIVDRDYITITLPLTAAGVEFYAERRSLEAFVDATCRMVPLGAELAPAGRELDRWLGEVSA
ncbi:SsgA family sporulation/cell division regulator [Nonomuraea sp. NPDC049646]|uniref:SsgA family sporulation/cell division regulator n=1 Tax=unclassified Nonomuraea TaxID=2593643 RepID=UPI003796BF21